MVVVGQADAESVRQLKPTDFVQTSEERAMLLARVAKHLFDAGIGRRGVLSVDPFHLFPSLIVLSMYAPTLPQQNPSKRVQSGPCQPC